MLKRVRPEAKEMEPGGVDLCSEIEDLPDCKAQCLSGGNGYLWPLAMFVVGERRGPGPAFEKVTKAKAAWERRDCRR